MNSGGAVPSFHAFAVNVGRGGGRISGMGRPFVFSSNMLDNEMVGRNGEGL